MKLIDVDAVVIGAGAAGMAAALSLVKEGRTVALADREWGPGGILPQCIHNGFGLHLFREELTGPEFSSRLERELFEGSFSSLVTFFAETTVTAIRDEGGKREVSAISPQGLITFRAGAVVLAMGSRERNRGNLRIPGSRPAGVFTAGLAQRLVNIEGCLPGKRAVIIGSGDIGLIMARRLMWSGCSVAAVIEILEYPSGLARNIAQCLTDFSIPLYLSSQTTAIYGRDRVEGVEVTPLEGGRLRRANAFRIDCDTVLLSVGLIPENELSREAGIDLHPVTGGPLVDSSLMTKFPGVFACGNVLHIHDLADYVVEEASLAGREASRWLSLQGKEEDDAAARVEAFHRGGELEVRALSNIRYISPGKVDPARDNRLFMRSLVVRDGAVLSVRSGGGLLLERKFAHVQPSEMLTLELSPQDLARAEIAVELSLE